MYSVQLKMMNSNYTLLLGSKSPRRLQLLKEAGFNPQVVDIEYSEDYPAALNVNEVARYLAEKKSMTYSGSLQNHVLLTADTVVILDNELLGKPEDPHHAKDMMKKLSGKQHLVITGVCLRTDTITDTFEDITEVYFKPLTEKEINHYIRNFNPVDKAGAYGIQEWIGMVGIDKIVGSYYNVVGLPIQKLYQHLTRFITIDF